jgi:hypothetical protein
MPEDMHPSSSGSDATFLGWQKAGSGEVFALYNITAAGHPSRGSTVTGRTLEKLNLQVPGTQPSQREPFGQQGSSENWNTRT